MAAKKPTKQQIAQAKARAGGNTTSKTTPARMAKGAKDIALFAATIAGPGKAAKAVKMAKDEIVMAKAGWNAAAKAGYRADVKRGTYAAQKQAYKDKVTTPAKKVVAAAKAEAKANARGLKAANKPVKNKDASVMNRNNQYARQAILNEKPARSTATRGGSMKSKQNWPESMKNPKPGRTKPNPPNEAKARESYLSSISRAGGAGRGPAGKAKDMRIAKSKRKSK